MTILKGNWNYPTQVRFGAGRIAELARACRSVGMSKPLIVTDPGIARLPMIAAAVAANEADGLPTAVFSDVRPNPTGANVEAGLKVYRDGGHDGVVAWGGGSGLDAGKAVALMAGQSLPIWDFEDIGDNWKRVDPDGVAPIIAVPTTAGTGSETGRASVILDEAAHVKRIVFHPKMLPSIVISDPELTVGLPAHITAATGMDALAHCFEAFCAPGFHPMADGIALEGMRLVKEWLPKAVADGTDIEARANMLAAASMGSTAFQKGLGGIHALSHPVGALYDTHQGLTNAVFHPYVMAWNMPAIEDRMARLAAYLGLAGGASGVMDWVLALRESFNLPHTIAGLGVEAAKIGQIAEMALADPSNGGNPVEMTVAGYAAILENAMEGRLN
ncbi:MAG: iron-containing alcohol dehydrogenase [Rhodospirillales bacterium]